MRAACKQNMCVQGIHCTRCAEDQRFLRAKQRPVIDRNPPVITAVDIFAGCGGMSLGLEEAARRAGFRIEIALAIDSDPQVAEIYRRNIKGKVKVANVTTLFDGLLGAEPTLMERQVAAMVGPVQTMVAAVNAAKA